MIGSRFRRAVVSSPIPHVVYYVAPRHQGYPGWSALEQPWQVAHRGAGFAAFTARSPVLDGTGSGMPESPAARSCGGKPSSPAARP